LILVDTHVLLDIATNDPNWADWSVAQLDAAAVRGPVVIKALVYSEFSFGYDQIEDVERLLKDVDIGWAETPREALFLAGKAFQQYRRQGASRTGVLPDFFIGAHAAVSRMTLLARDPARYRSYVPKVGLISPT
jgi:predicted nucleic acid-binding protein